MTISHILIANRGEIACRIIKTAKELGLKTLAIYTEADKDAPHRHMADNAVNIGKGAASDSYLNGDKIINVAVTHGADAIHPGYGFLSENSDFAQKLQKAGLIFIAPPASAIAAMGNKAEAKRKMREKGVPCIPGYEGEAQEDAIFAQEAEKIGFPVMVKAAAGGGGRGMRLVHQADKLVEALTLARSESLNAFGSDELILEKALISPRHVEIQIFADAYGNFLHLGERDCSMQRRHQKIIEEAPCPVMDENLRAHMGEAAIQVAKAVDYVGAGTVEFLLDADKNFYFLEMNTRLQVEHPVTEMITGQDLVAWQISIANGAPLPLTQDEISLAGHAIEARLYAENPANDFFPATGNIRLWQPATGEGVRIDAGIKTGTQISPLYDPMLAKIIAHGATREIARARLVTALHNTALFGIVNNKGFLGDALNQPAFIAGEVTTAFMAESYPQGYGANVPIRQIVAIAAALFFAHACHKAYQASMGITEELRGFTSGRPYGSWLNLYHEGNEFSALGQIRDKSWQIIMDETSYDIILENKPDALEQIVHVGDEKYCLMAFFESHNHLTLDVEGQNYSFMRSVPGKNVDTDGASGRILAPMPGLVQDIFVKVGDRVKAGDRLAVLEAMKMQHPVLAPFDGRVEAIAIKEKEQLARDDLIMELEKIS